MYHEVDRPEREGWFSRLHLTWPMLLLAGWLLYELTAQPGLAALVACAKFGLGEVYTAIWLRRVDPDRRRGQTCFWAYLAYGLWKVAVMASLTMIVLGFISTLFDRVPRQPQANNGLSPVLGGALAAAAVGFGLSFPTAYLALWSARRNGVRIWLGQAPSRARRERFWPPHHGAINAAPFVGFCCLVLTLWFLVFTWVCLALLLQPMGFGVAIFFSIMILPTFLTVFFLIRMSLQVMARSPQECWTAEEGEAVYQIQHAEESMSEA